MGEARKEAEVNDISTMTEKKLREVTVPTPETEEELLGYIRQLLSRKHDYGTRVYAVSLATVATFHYMARELGISLFQASCADLDVLRRCRNLKFGFRILDYSELLFPQYLNRENFPTIEDLLFANRKWLQREAKRLLEKESANEVDPKVREHWQKLAGQK